MEAPKERGFVFQLLVALFLLFVGILIVLGNWLLDSAAAKALGLLLLVVFVFMVGVRITARVPGETADRS